MIDFHVSRNRIVKCSLGTKITLLNSSQLDLCATKNVVVNGVNIKKLLQHISSVFSVVMLPILSLNEKRVLLISATPFHKKNKPV